MLKTEANNQYIAGHNWKIMKMKVVILALRNELQIEKETEIYVRRHSVLTHALVSPSVVKIISDFF